MTTKIYSSKIILFALALTAFGIGFTEFVSAGILPMLTSDLDISLGTASLTISVYAGSVTIGAPLLTAVTSFIEKKKKLLLMIITFFVIGHIISALAPSFLFLLIGRVISAFAHGGFMALAPIVAANLVDSDKRASAISIVLSGLTIATILGAPLGTFVAQVTRWRFSFALIGLIGLIGLILNAVVIPGSLSISGKSSLKSIFTVLFHRKMFLLYLATIIGYGSTFVVYSYISPILATDLHYSESSIVIILLLYGAMVAIGNGIGGRISNIRPLKMLPRMYFLLALSLLALYFSYLNPIFALVTLLCIGLFAFMNVPASQFLVVLEAEKHLPNDVTMASALCIAAFNVGISLGTFVGGGVLEYFGMRFTGLFGFVIAIIAVVLTLIIGKSKSKNNSSY